MWHQGALLARIGISFPNNVIKFVMFHTKNRYQDVMSLIGKKKVGSKICGFQLICHLDKIKKIIKTIFHKRTANSYL